ncbi:MAG TPA: dihydrodipicolinate synthase family protein [Chloroflexota bacterium]|nr:dihydrodipicolinate synthase family protein [Chloroflexota bacterium]
MLTPQDLHGVMAMMPAFATADAADIRAEHTVDVDHLKEGVDKAIRDGVDVIATTGSFGEFHTLLPEEFETLARATVEAVNKRVPLFIGATGLNSREVVRKMRVVRDAGADGALVGVPFYFPSTVDNALRFYREIGEMFPTLNIMIYHNPPLHNIHIPVEAFPKILENRNVIGMKDSHRNPRAMMELHRLAAGRLSHFVHAGQYYGYAPLGAAGLWSYDLWMGPWPVLALRDAMAQGDLARAREITFEITDAYDAPMNLQWRETAAKLAIGAAGYVQPGPLRPPFLEIPAEVQERIQKRARYWTELCAKYRPRVEAR